MAEESSEIDRRRELAGVERVGEGNESEKDDEDDEVHEEKVDVLDIGGEVGREKVEKDGVMRGRVGGMASAQRFTFTIAACKEKCQSATGEK